MFSHNLKITHWIKKKSTYIGVAVLGVSALLTACEIPGEDTQVTTDTTMPDDITGTTPETIGEKITVRNFVQETIGDYGFVIEADTGESVIVINTTGEVFTLPDPSIPIQATGEVRELILTEIEGEYGVVLEPELYTEYENQPVVLAESLAFAATPEDLAEAPMDYFMDKQIAVEGDLRQVEGLSNALALFEEGWIDDIGVLVIATDETLDQAGEPFEEGENLVVTGTARQFNRELVQEAGLDWSEEEITEFEEQYTGRPVIFADGLYPSATDPAPTS